MLNRLISWKNMEQLVHLILLCSSIPTITSILFSVVLCSLEWLYFQEVFLHFIVWYRAFVRALQYLQHSHATEAVKLAQNRYFKK